MNRTIHPGPFICVAALLALLATSCDQHDSQDGNDKSETATTHPTEAGKPTEVHLTKDAVEEAKIAAEPATKRVLIPTLAVVARVAFNSEAVARIGAPVAGRAVEPRVRLGDAVKKDDPLIIVESTDLGEAQGDYLLKRTAAEAAEAAVEPARIAYDRGKALFEKQQGIAQSELEKRHADLVAAQATLRAAQAAAAAAKNKLVLMGMSTSALGDLEKDGKIEPRYTIRSPIAGQVIQFDLSLNQLVGPDKELPLTVADVGKLWVLADIPEAQYSQVRAGAAARLSVAALPDEHFQGKVTLLAPAIDAATRTVQARIEADNSKGLLRPGMFARAEIDLPRAGNEPVLALPSDAVQLLDGQTIVFVPVEHEEGKFKRQDVKAGPPVGGWTPILSGLKEGEKVVTQGAFILRAQLAKPAEEE
jgi:cobalt-zinc-cadmium efflux system membrane fusion protein